MKRVLSLLLVLMLLCSVLPASIADDTDRPAEPDAPAAETPIDAADGLPPEPSPETETALVAPAAPPQTNGQALMINSTNFPDEEFRYWVIENLSVSGDDETGYYMTEDQVDAVTVIYIRTDVSGLRGIEFFPKLQYLYFEGCHVAALDVSHNPCLDYLNCAGNQLTSLDVTNNPKLRQLWCASNQLTALDVTKNEKLEYLSCFDNRLSALDVTKNASLSQLIAESNALTALDTTQNPLLFYLSCGRNQLTALDVSHNAALQSLYCNNNQLTALDVSQNAALTQLSCGYNRLTALSVRSNPALNSLSCEYNRLTALDLSQNAELVSLYCANNLIPALNLSANGNLTYSWLNQTLPNRAGIYSAGVYSFDLGALVGLENLARVTLADPSSTLSADGIVSFACKTDSFVYYYDTGFDPMTVTVKVVYDDRYLLIDETNFPDEEFRNAILGNIPYTYHYDPETGNSIYYFTEEQALAVKDFEIYGFYKIMSLKGVEHFTNLESLRYNAYNNPDGSIPELDLSHNKKLKSLSISGTDLAALDISQNPALVELNCRYNKISDLKLNTAIESLNCSENPLTALDLSVCPALVTFVCNFAPLSSVTLPASIESFQVTNNKAPIALDLSGCPVLKTILCQDSLITSLKLNSAVETLDCSYNRDIGALDVSGCRSLKNLSCIRCGLTVLNLSSCEALESLSCSENLLTTLDLSVCPLLTSADCYENRLTVLIPGSALELLWCSDNKFTSLDLTAAHRLTDLECDNCAITSLKLPASIVTLVCSANRIDTLDCSTLPNLEELYCGGNGMTALNVKNNPLLTYLNCGTGIDGSNTGIGCIPNRLTELDLSGCPDLFEVYCDGCFLSSLDLSQNGNLSYLDVTGNRITTLDLSACPHIEYAWVYGQSVIGAQLIPSGGRYVYDLGALVGRENLGKVTLGETTATFDPDTGLVTFPEPVGDFTYSYATGYAAHPLMATVYFGSPLEQYLLINEASFPDANFRAWIVSNLDCVRVPDGDAFMSKAQAEAVEDIWIEGVEIRTVKGIEHFPNLRVLDAAECGLTELDVSHNPALRELYCSANADDSSLPNRIVSLDLSHNTQLEYLDCRGNRLATLDLSHNTQLQDAVVSPQTLPQQQGKVDGNKYTFDLAALVDAANLANVRLNDAANTINAQGVVTFPGPVESFVYLYDTGHGLMDVTVPLTFEEVQPSDVMSTAANFMGKMLVNYYIVMSEEVLDDKDAYVEIKLNDDVKKVLVRDADTDEKNGVLRHKFEMEVPSKCMRDDIVLKLHAGNGSLLPLTYKQEQDVTEGFVYHMVDYLRGRQQNSTSETMRRLAYTAEWYGTACQLYFNHHVNQLTEAEIAAMNEALNDASIMAGLANYAPIEGGTLPNGITKRSNTVVFESDNTLRTYFYTANPGAYTFTMDDNEIHLSEWDAGKYNYDIPNIPGKELAKWHKVTATDGTNTYTYKTSALGYCYGRAANSSNVDMQNLAKTLYLYGKAAMAYFGVPDQPAPADTPADPAAPAEPVIPESLQGRDIQLPIVP